MLSKWSAMGQPHPTAKGLWCGTTFSNAEGLIECEVFWFYCRKSSSQNRYTIAIYDRKLVITVTQKIMDTTWNRGVDKLNESYNVCGSFPCSAFTVVQFLVKVGGENKKTDA